MDIQRIDKDLLNELLQKALHNERHRYAYDLRNSPEDTSQRMIFPSCIIEVKDGKYVEKK